MTKLTLSILLSIILLSITNATFAQSDLLHNDLQKSFRGFELVQVNNQKAQQEAESKNQITLTTSTGKYQLVLTPRDLRARNFRAEDTSAEGTKQIEKSVVNTYKGKVLGDAASDVRLTLNGKSIEGYFISQGRKNFVAPAKNFSEFADENDLLIYQEGNFLNSESFNCENEVGEKIEAGKKYLESNKIEVDNVLRVIRFATDADYEYVKFKGSADAANREILSILNMVEGTFERDLNLTFSVVFQHTWSTADPFVGTDATAYLESFRNYWNTNFTDVKRDLAHIWTGHANLKNRGYAFNAIICDRPDYAYAFSGRVDWDEAKGLITAHEIGHNLGASHADADQNCGNTIMNTVLTVGAPLSFCSVSKEQILKLSASPTTCLAPASSAKATATRFDFDNDGKSDVGVFRSSNGVWYIANSGGGYNFFQFGANGDKPVSGDFDGDGKNDAGVFRNGIWYRMKSSTGSYDGVAFGVATDIPVPADFDGDGKTDTAVFRPSNGTWYILKSTTGGMSAAAFGANGDVPMPADYDGDGKADINVFRPSTGTWYRINSNNGSVNGVAFGQRGDIPVVGDFDGDGKGDIVVFRPANGAWYILKSSNSSFTGMGFGMNGDLPVADDFDGDGKTDIAVFRPSSGHWFRINSKDNSFAASQFGIGTDIPVQSN